MPARIPFLPSSVNASTLTFSDNTGIICGPAATSSAGLAAGGLTAAGFAAAGAFAVPFFAVVTLFAVFFAAGFGGVKSVHEIPRSIDW